MSLQRLCYLPRNKIFFSPLQMEVPWYPCQRPFVMESFVKQSKLIHSDLFTQNLQLQIMAFLNRCSLWQPDCSLQTEEFILQPYLRIESWACNLLILNSCPGRHTCLKEVFLVSLRSKTKGCFHVCLFSYFIKVSCTSH